MRIRPAVAEDEGALGPMGAALMRLHHEEDPRRFLLTERPERGYGRFLASVVGDPETLVLVAEDDRGIQGYVFAQIESTSWRDLRGPCGFVHDVYVRDEARGMGVGEALLRAALAWVRARGRTQVVLWTKTHNAAAQRLFTKLGFRETMREMTLDQDASGSGT